MRRTTIGMALVAALALTGLVAGLVQFRPRSKGMAVTAAAARAGRRHPPLLPGVKAFDTAHYRIHSTATPEQTAQVAQAVESLYGHYTRVLSGPGTRARRLTLVLYRDRAEFKRNNRSRPWAEAYYLPPRSYAYFA